VRGGDLEAENRELRKRTKQLKQENEILRRATLVTLREAMIVDELTLIAPLRRREQGHDDRIR